MVYKSLAAILFSLGAFSLITAGTLPAMADPACNGSVIEPGMECEAAHAVNREEAADIDLIFNELKSGQRRHTVFYGYLREDIHL